MVRHAAAASAAVGLPAEQPARRLGSHSPARGPAIPEELPSALLMPGQGAQYQGMGTGLYAALPAFAAILDEVFEIMGAAGDELRADWLATDPALPLEHVLRSQPLLFAIDYALGRLLRSLGLRPAVMLGHSVGELAAATLAGVFDLDDAIRFLQHRVNYLARAPAGGMAAIAASHEEVAPYLRPGVDIGAINAPRQTVIAGPDEPLRTTTAALREAGFTCAPILSLTPFHSTVLRPVVDVIGRLLAGRPMQPPAIALISGYTARRLTDAEAVEPLYWARHDVDPVLYWPALESLLATGPHLLIECGPGEGLITLARRHPDVRSGRCKVLSLLGSTPPGPGGEAEHFATAAIRLGLRIPQAAARRGPRGAVEYPCSAVRQARLHAHARGECCRRPIGSRLRTRGLATPQDRDQRRARHPPGYLRRVDSHSYRHPDPPHRLARHAHLLSGR